MKRTNKARPAWAERAGGGSGDVGNVLSYPYNSTRPPPCQVPTSSESFWADLSQHIGNIIPRSGPRLGDSSDAPRTGLKAKAWTDVYVKFKVAFRQKALRLLKGSTAMPATRNGCGNRAATRKPKPWAKPPGLHRSTLRW